VQTQTILKGETTEFPFVLLDSKTKLGKPGVALASIAIAISKAAGPLVPVVAPAITDAKMGLYYWAPTEADLDTIGDLVYFATAPGCDDWRDMYTVTETPPPVVPPEVAATMAEIMAAVRHDLSTEIGRLAALYPQLVAIVGEPG
jgi:hypothetical protein